MINPSVSPQVNNLSAEMRNCKTDASGWDRRHLLRDCSLAGRALFANSGKQLGHRPELLRVLICHVVFFGKILLQMK